MSRVLIVLSLICSLAVVASADPPKELITVDLRTGKLVWEWEPESEDWRPEYFRVACGPSQDALTITADVPHPEMKLALADLLMEDGTYVCVVWAQSADATTATSNAVWFRLTTLPPPTNLRVIGVIR